MLRHGLCSLRPQLQSTFLRSWNSPGASLGTFSIHSWIRPNLQHNLQTQPSRFFSTLRNNGTSTLSNLINRSSIGSSHPFRRSFMFIQRAPTLGATNRAAWKHYATIVPSGVPPNAPSRSLLRFLNAGKPLTKEDIFTLFSWLMVGTTFWIIVGSTSLISVLLWFANTLQFQGMVAFANQMHSQLDCTLTWKVIYFWVVLNRNIGKCSGKLCQQSDWADYYV